MGVVLYELLTGCLPYGIKGRASAAELEHSIVAAEVTRPSIHLALRRRQDYSSVTQQQARTATAR
jgi:hypothetical protein